MLMADDSPTYADLSESDQRFARMLFFSLWPNGGGFASYDDAFEALRGEPAFRGELRAVMDISWEETRHLASELGGPLTGSPLLVHARYQREEILAGLDSAHLKRSPRASSLGSSTQSRGTRMLSL